MDDPLSILQGFTPEIDGRLYRDLMTLIFMVGKS